MVNVALVDDHKLLRGALVSTVNSFEGFKVSFEADNGRRFIDMLDTNPNPDVVLLDIAMPEMNGYETAAWIKSHRPQIRVIVLTMNSEERAIIKMMRQGAKGYLLKDAEKHELEAALKAVMTKGIYINELVYNNIVLSMNTHLMDDESEKQKVIELSEREKEFLRLLCTDKSYKEIAAEMILSPRTIDGYRDNLFDKLKVNSRVGLAIFAIRNNIVQI